MYMSIYGQVNVVKPLYNYIYIYIYISREISLIKNIKKLFKINMVRI